MEFHCSGLCSCQDNLGTRYRGRVLQLHAMVEVQYIEMEMMNKFINYARNVWDRCFLESISFGTSIFSWRRCWMLNRFKFNNYILAAFILDDASSVCSCFRIILGLVAFIVKEEADMVYSSGSDCDCMPALVSSIHYCDKP